jgi:MFS family permease
LYISTRGKSSNHSLSIPILAALIFTVVCVLPVSSMSVLFKEISRDLNLSVVQIGSVWGVASFGAIFITPFGGLLCDRLGAKRTIVMMSIISGIIAVLMGTSNGFISLMLTTLIWGTLSSTIVPAINMAASQASSSSRQALAQGLIACGAGLGFTLGSLFGATLLSPLLGGWRHVLYFYGGIAIVFSLYWQFKVKLPERNSSKGSEEIVSFQRAFAYLFRLKALWLIGLCFMFYQCCTVGMLGYLPYFLQNIGWDVTTASSTLAVFMAVSTLGAIPLAILSDRTGSRKILLQATFLSSIAGVGLISIVHNEVLWALVILASIFYGVAPALFTTLCIENKEVGAAYSGTAVGIMLGIANIGKTFAPPLGNSLADISSTIAWPFIFWAALGIIASIILIFIKETGRRGESKKIPGS